MFAGLFSGFPAMLQRRSPSRPPKMAQAGSSTRKTGLTCGNVVGVAGFEPTASSSRSSTGLSAGARTRLSRCIDVSAVVRGRPALVSVVVTQLVTQPLRPEPRLGGRLRQRLRSTAILFYPTG